MEWFSPDNVNALANSITAALLAYTAKEIRLARAERKHLQRMENRPEA